MLKLASDEIAKAVDALKSLLEGQEKFEAETIDLEDGTKKMDELNQKNSLFDTHTPLLFGTH